ncbi:MAG TPA: KTSC domain-containing protein [Rhizomicrobium sp.]|nr:KTSC domain-containing protein [Rhizomicrobium sp.]
MPVLDSAALAAVWYDEKRRILRATFRDSERTYAYDDVPPEEFAALMKAGSRGAYFNAHIRGRYKFREVH